MMRRFIHYLLRLIVCGMLAWAAVASAADIDITYARIERSDEGYAIAANFKFELSRDLENVITSGIPLYFVTEVDITRPRWYWFDENSVTNERSVRISYNVITRQYRASINGGVARSYNDLNDALTLVRNPSRWLVADKTELDGGETYTAALRIYLDTDKLPKPFQFNALNNSDWRLSSDWKRMTFKADE